MTPKVTSEAAEAFLDLTERYGRFIPYDERADFFAALVDFHLAAMTDAQLIYAAALKEAEARYRHVL